MPEAAVSTSKQKTGAADQRTLAYVEKWLAVIREISGERK